MSSSLHCSLTHTNCRENARGTDSHDIIIRRTPAVSLIICIGRSYCCCQRGCFSLVDFYRLARQCDACNINFCTMIHRQDFHKIRRNICAASLDGKCTLGTNFLKVESLMEIRLDCHSNKTTDRICSHNLFNIKINIVRSRHRLGGNCSRIIADYINRSCVCIQSCRRRSRTNEIIKFH